MKHWFCLCAILSLSLFTHMSATVQAVKPELKVGAAAVTITPFGSNADWDGTIAPNGVWGETFTDQNNNGVWDAGEPFVDDEGNTALDMSSKNK